jgi:hypothetical protein
MGLLVLAHGSDCHDPGKASDASNYSSIASSCVTKMLGYATASTGDYL